jgi:DNA-binding NarL/FixJ family response regulator
MKSMHGSRAEQRKNGASDGDAVIRILIADDHDVVRRGLRDILQDHAGWEVIAEAANGKDAISTALQTRPDIAIVDYTLPLLSGIEVTRQIRARLPNTAVLIFTMHDSDLLMQRALQAGARGFLLKSDADDFLIAAIHSLVQGKPFFTGRVSEKLLQSFLLKTETPSLLSPREQSVVQLIAEGKTNKEMARILSLSAKTIESHRASALRKLNLATTADLIRYAVRNKLVEA